MLTDVGVSERACWNTNTIGWWVGQSNVICGQMVWQQI